MKILSDFHPRVLPAAAWTRTELLDPVGDGERAATGRPGHAPTVQRVIVAIHVGWQARRSARVEVVPEILPTGGCPLEVPPCAMC